MSKHTKEKKSQTISLKSESNIHPSVFKVFKLLIYIKMQLPQFIKIHHHHPLSFTCEVKTLNNLSKLIQHSKKKFIDITECYKRTIYFSTVFFFFMQQ